MPTTTINLTPATVIAAGTSNSVGSATREARDMRTKHGGLVTMKITNGATGPTAQCIGRIMVAHDSGATPATGAAGAVWKTIFEFGGGTANNAVTEQHVVLPPCCHFQVEYSGNTVQAVTVEASVTDYTSLATS